MAALTLAAAEGGIALARAPASDELVKRLGLVPCLPDIDLGGVEAYYLLHASTAIARRVGRYLERQGLLERDADDCMDAGGRATQGAVAENSYLTTDAVSEDSMNQLLGYSITYRIAVGPQAGRKVFA